MKATCDIYAGEELFVRYDRGAAAVAMGEDCLPPPQRRRPSPRSGKGFQAQSRQERGDSMSLTTVVKGRRQLSQTLV